MDDLLAEFVAETREMLAAIEGELVAWEADPADRARLDSIFRFVHTVKGNCGFFDFPRLEQLSHAAETALADVRAGRRSASTSLVNAVLAVIDRITELVAAIDSGAQPPSAGDERLIAALEPDSDEEMGEIDVLAALPGERRTAAANSPVRSIRLPVDLLDRLMSGVSDMVLARNDLARRLRDMGDQLSVDGPFERLSTILNDVRDGVTRIRMQRIGHLYNALPRLVRDLSAELGKQVMIDLQDSEVEIDREMIEIVRDPLTHIIRNAIDHGIERPGERLAAGKREIGLLSISARQAGNRILLAVRDDGRGLDVARITAKAVAQGIATEAEIKALSPEQQLALIFEPGLSTAETVSEVSGRGVGMDVVRANLEKVRGTIRVESEPGEGTLFVLELPLTLSIVAALTVASGAARYAIPRSYIEEIVRGTSNAIQIEELGEARFIQFRGKRIPAIGLNRILGEATTLSMLQSVFIIVRLAKGDLFALVVDRVLDSEDLVVKPLAPPIMATGVYAGSTLLDDGLPILILDIPRIAGRHHLVSSMTTLRTQTAAAVPAAAPPSEQMILLTDLAGRRRAIAMAAVRRILALDSSELACEGQRWQASFEGAIVPVAGINAPLPDEARIIALYLSDGVRELLYAARAVDNSATLEGTVSFVAGDPELAGIALIDGAITGVLDVHALFAGHGNRVSVAAAKTCRLPDGDEWAQTILRPLLESAGYGVLTSGTDGSADVTIVSDESSASAGDGVPVIRLRAAPAPAGPGDTSIYRYDRAAVLAALGHAVAGAK